MANPSRPKPKPTQTYTGRVVGKPGPITAKRILERLIARTEARLERERQEAERA